MSRLPAATRRTQAAPGEVGFDGQNLPRLEGARPLAVFLFEEVRLPIGTVIGAATNDDLHHAGQGKVSMQQCDGGRGVISRLALPSRVQSGKAE